MRPDEVNQRLNTLPISAWEWPRPVVFVPVERTISYADRVLPWIVGLAQQGLPWIHHDYGVTADVRNSAVTKFLASDYTHLIMLDLDHVHQLDIVQQLTKWFLLRDDVQVVGGLNFRRNEPFSPCVAVEQADGWYSPAEWEQGLIAVDMLGTGCIMIARSVFEAIDPPWFYYEWDADRGHHLSDDWGFCRHCRAAGIPLHVDTTVTSLHLAPSGIGEGAFKQHLALSQNGQAISAGGVPSL